jgi:hypothetical protein
MAKHTKAHPGFKSVQAKITKRSGVSKERAGAILAAASRGASAQAKRATGPEMTNYDPTIQPFDEPFRHVDDRPPDGPVISNKP